MGWWAGSLEKSRAGHPASTRTTGWPQSGPSFQHRPPTPALPQPPSHPPRRPEAGRAAHSGTSHQPHPSCTPEQPMQEKGPPPRPNEPTNQQKPTDPPTHPPRDPEAEGAVHLLVNLPQPRQHLVAEPARQPGAVEALGAGRQGAGGRGDHADECARRGGAPGRVGVAAAGRPAPPCSAPCTPPPRPGRRHAAKRHERKSHYLPKCVRSHSSTQHIKSGLTRVAADLAPLVLALRLVHHRPRLDVCSKWGARENSRCTLQPSVNGGEGAAGAVNHARLRSGLHGWECACVVGRGSPVITFSIEDVPLQGRDKNNGAA